MERRESDPNRPQRRYGTVANATYKDDKAGNKVRGFPRNQGNFGVDPTRLELVASAMRGRRSPN